MCRAGVSALSDQLRLIFLQEISRQATWAVKAVDQLRNALARDDALEMFRSLEIFLGHTAKISLILWPEARGNESRGNQLRTLLELNDNNPLRDRSARNDMQHFDERIDQWANSTGGRIFVDSNVGPYPIPIRINGESPEALRHFDPKAQLFVFRSQKYDIGVLVEAVRDVLSRANESERAITETMKREAIKEGIRRNERLKTTPKQD